MIPQRAEILPRSVANSEAASVGKGILLPLDQTGNHFLGIKDLAKPLNSISGELHDQWSYMAHVTAARYPFESLLSPFARGNVVGNADGYGAFDFSFISGASRKNATRETTSPLKAWLHEHRKNPYPTKGEKIMLAILTKMTLTQISTWFANARRRLKKDNKMTWCPRNKSSDKRESVSQTSKQQPNDSSKSASSSDDDECVSADDSDQEPKSTDVCLEDDVFSEECRSEGERKAAIQDSKLLKEKNDLPSNQSTKPSQETALKKISFCGNNSPVGNLQRWVDGHFGSQSPIDFPRELTPPRTPVEEIVSSGSHTGREARKSKDVFHTVMQDVENVKKSQESALKRKASDDNFNWLKERSKVFATSSSNEELVKSIAQNEIGLQRQFRSCGLTSHREIDAVLALTSLASR